MPLTPQQVLFFRHNGFLKLPTRLPPESVERLKETIARHIQEEIAPIMRDRQGRVVRISQLWDRDPLFREVLASPALLDPLEGLLGANIEFVKNRHNHATLRLAGEGTEYFHRDALQWSRAIATVLFYLQETTLENGCTWVVPGSHLSAGSTIPSVEKDEALRRSGLLDQALPVPMPAGGMLVIDGTLIHTAGENRTAGTRMSMTAGYHSADELYDLENPKRVLLRGERVYMGNDR